MLDALIFRDDEGHTPLMNQPAHQPTHCVLKHLFNHGLGPTATIGAREPGRDAIAMHSLKHFAGRNKNVVATLVGP